MTPPTKHKTKQYKTNYTYNNNTKKEAHKINKGNQSHIRAHKQHPKFASKLITQKITTLICTTMYIRG